MTDVTSLSSWQNQLKRQALAMASSFRTSGRPPRSSPASLDSEDRFAAVRKLDPDCDLPGLVHGDWIEGEFGYRGTTHRITQRQNPIRYRIGPGIDSQFSPSRRAIKGDQSRIID